MTADTDLGVEEAEDRQHARSKGEWVSFFDWFRGDEGDEGGADAGADVVGRVIREEVWLDPLRYYRGRVEDVRRVWVGLLWVVVCGGGGGGASVGMADLCWSIGVR